MEIIVIRRETNMKNTNVNGDAQQLRLYMTQAKLNGTRNIGGGDEYEMLPLLFTGNCDTLRGDEVTGETYAGYNVSNKYCVRIAK